MRFFDFFSGIGGFRLGMEMAGHECVGHCEIDKYARRSYAAMYPESEKEVMFEDVRTINPWDMPECECYCFGFPCQSFSIDGKRGGFADTRGTLFFEIMRIAEARHPSILFAENVRGLLNHQGGDTFRTIIGTMYELGYNVEWQCINSKYYIPQNRERVYIVGHFRGKPARPVFPIFGNGEAVDGIQGQGIYPAVTSGTITTRTGTAESVGTYPMNNGGVLKVHGFHKLEQREKEDAANGFDVTEGGGLLIDGEEVRIRKLTPRECWRLQGFPDELFERAAAVNSDSQLYKQAGNSVTVNVIYEIAKRLKEGE